ncbi:ComEC/Rec2 family competence protein [Cupriavidus basilensis]
MLSIAALAAWSARTPPASVVLAWAAFVALLLDPWAVTAPGFWLSFGAVGVIFLAASRPSAGERILAADARVARRRSAPRNGRSRLGWCR